MSFAVELAKARRLTQVERLVRARDRTSSQQTTIEAAFRRAVTAVSAQARAKDIAEAIASGNVLRVEQVMNWPEFGQPIMDIVQRPALIESLQAGGAAEVRIILGRPLYALDITQSEAINWLRTAGYVALEQSTNVRREALLVYMEQAARRGLSVLEAARELRDLRIVGLTPRQVRAIANFGMSLKASGIVGEDAAKRVAAYVSRSLAYRAETIAMDLMTRAFAAGQRALWAQASREGFIDPRKAVQQWVSLEDACIICGALDRVVVQIGQPFPGGYMGPGDPHPRCRCMVLMWPNGVPVDLAA